MAEDLKIYVDRPYIPGLTLREMLVKFRELYWEDYQRDVYIPIPYDSATNPQNFCVENQMKTIIQTMDSRDPQKPLITSYPAFSAVHVRGSKTERAFESDYISMIPVDPEDLLPLRVGEHSEQYIRDLKAMNQRDVKMNQEMHETIQRSSQESAPPPPSLPEIQFDNVQITMVKDKVVIDRTTYQLLMDNCAVRFECEETYVHHIEISAEGLTEDQKKEKWSALVGLLNRVDAARLVMEEARKLLERAQLDAEESTQKTTTRKKKKNPKSIFIAEKLPQTTDDPSSKKQNNDNNNKE